MPLVQITLVEGRDDATVQTCLKAVAKTVHETLDAPYSSIRVYAQVIPADKFVVGEFTKAELTKKEQGAGEAPDLAGKN